MIRYKKSYRPIRANDNDATVPEFWANETLAILEENMVIANMVHRDFENQLAQYGDVVNTRKPSEMRAINKVDGEAITIQNAQTTNIQVPLNQWTHTSFMIYDGERSKSFKDLVQIHLRPAALAIRRKIDRTILGAFTQFVAAGQFTGGFNKLTGGNAKDKILDMRKVQNKLKVPVEGRNMIWGPSAETEVLKTDIFLSAERVGDQGSALREASIGHKLGYDHWMSQNMSEIYDLNTATTGAVNMALGAPAGTTSVTVDGFSAAIGVNSWVMIDGQPYRVVTTTGGATPTVIQIQTGLVEAVADNAVVKAYTPGQVNNSGGYAAGYNKEITVDTFSVAPQVGQMVSFGITAPSATPSGATAVYTITEVNALVGITLDRPLEAAIADDAKVNIGPPGYYNLAFLGDAIAFVCRPLALPPSGVGALSHVAQNGQIAVRSTVTYNPTLQGMLITLDLLYGIKVIEPLKGAVLIG